MARPTIDASLKVRRQVVLVWVLGAVVLFLPLRMLWGMRTNVLNQINTVQTEQAANMSRVQQAEQVRGDRSEFLATLGRLTSAMPQYAELADVIDDLSEVAKQAGVTLASAEPVAPTVGGGTDGATPGQTGQVIAPLPPGQGTAQGSAPDSTGPASASMFKVTATIAGTPRSVFDFIARLRALPRLYVVDATTYSWSTEAKSNLMTTTVVVYAYSWQPTYSDTSTPANSTTTTTTTIPSASTTTVPNRPPANTPGTTVPPDGAVLEPTGPPVTLAPDKQPVVQPVTVGRSCSGAEGYRGIASTGAYAKCLGGVWKLYDWSKDATG